MITRTWHGRTHRRDGERYLQFLLTEGTREYKEIPGNISVRVWRAVEDDACHFWTVTEWKDIESIRAFAGQDYSKAKYYPFDEGMLLEFEEHVHHYESWAV